MVDGRFQCFGLEDEYRIEKVASETRIPPGTYKMGVRMVGGFHQRYTAKFPLTHKGMLQVLDVPGFEYILIHIGNSDKDTAGCLLVGRIGCAVPGEIRVNSSLDAYKSLYDLVFPAALAGDLEIDYQDNDQV